MIVAKIKRKWFDLIAEDVKKEDYREINPYWAKKIKRNEDAKYIRFENGYSKKCPKITLEYLGYDVKKANKNWANNHDTTFFALQLGKIVKLENYEHGI